MRFVVITGPSGAGKTLAMHAFEDAGYYTADNLPPRLLSALVQFCQAEGYEKAAVVVDTRSGQAFSEMPEVLQSLRSLQGTEPGELQIELLFLDASEEALVRRYKETRRPHPLITEPVGGIVETGIVEAIDAERTLLQTARDLADSILDTTSFSAQQLREAIYSAYSQTTKLGLLVTVSSFGFKHGLPLDADLVFDVRFLANPHYVPELKALDGRDPKVAAYIHNDPVTQPFEEKMVDLVQFALPEYEREGKAYLNIAIGCTGGQHRSVTLAEDLARQLQQGGYRVALRHRDVATQTGRPAQTSEMLP